WTSLGGGFADGNFIGSIFNNVFYETSGGVIKLNTITGQTGVFMHGLSRASVVSQVKDDLLMATPNSNFIYTSDGDSAWNFVGNLDGTVVSFSKQGSSNAFGD